MFDLIFGGEDTPWRKGEVEAAHAMLTEMLKKKEGDIPGPKNIG